MLWCTTRGKQGALLMFAQQGLGAGLFIPLSKEERYRQSFFLSPAKGSAQQMPRPHLQHKPNAAKSNTNISYVSEDVANLHE